MELKVENLHKSFDGQEVLHGISFSIQSGKALGLLGRNGAGKTTTIRILMDVFKANEGTIFIDGKPFHPSEYKIGYMPEERGMYPKKRVDEQLIYFAQLRGIKKAEAKKEAQRWLDRLHIKEYEHRKLETLSKGNQQKIQLIQTLICNPDIVILDEPFSGLDPVNSQLLKDVVKDLIQEGKLVIFSSHQMSYVEEFCEDILIINKGEVALQGNLHDIKKEYGYNRLVLNISKYTPMQMRALCTAELKDIVDIYEERKDCFILELKSGHTKLELLNTLVGLQLNIEKFMEYEPTLTDIFVLKAGDHA
ncbi:MAG: ATP-binding cassette domain-containing protein [Dorea sp.]|jgi:ABC-2 type transport system ATP-binding protein|nr:ATP-binding cassette domain-containing protein [Erysipelotrichaceae bacterium]MCI9075855.1 ATP-binding cassette domain-containing protein [Dorea sp.]